MPETPALRPHSVLHYIQGVRPLAQRHTLNAHRASTLNRLLAPRGRPFLRRSACRSTLRDLHAFGIISVFRRHSLFRLWEPLREPAGRSDDFSS